MRRYFSIGGFSSFIVIFGMSKKPTKELKAVENTHLNRNYVIEFTAPEFTCLCPMTGQPDFATIYIRYIPDKTIVELKSLKLYLWSFRDEGIFHETLTNVILDDLVNALAPRWMEVIGEFYVRGGIDTVVRAEHNIEKRPLG